ncbi:MAG: radical SAM protein [Methanoregulaceae archaeon]|nr:radical SAM protein [Methanoregulaceae archaeon]
MKGTFSEAPRLVSWNITLRCPLSCAHCYVDAGERESEGVLSTDEARGVIDQICETGRPILVLSGGEPLLRDDIFTLARYGTGRGLRMVMGTSGYLLDACAAGRLREAGIKAVAISLDSADPSVHDTFRGVVGVWERAVQAIRHCQNEGIRVQVNMSIVRPDIREVEGVVSLGTGLGVHDYQVFFPVPTGRAREKGFYGPEEYETLIREVLVRYQDTPVNIRPTCAPQFRRIADDIGVKNPAWGRGCIAGITYCRIYANGEVTPCPYLPVSAGNIRKTPFSEIWNHSEIFSLLRDTSRLTGKCGLCHHNAVCGGCRARAYRGAGALSSGWCDGLARPEELQGEICAEDPLCPYQSGEIAK